MSLLNKNRHAEHHAEGGSLPAYTVATLPAAAGREGALVYVSNAGTGSPDASGGSVAYSDGTNWIDLVTGSTVTTP